MLTVRLVFTLRKACWFLALICVSLASAQIQPWPREARLSEYQVRAHDPVMVKEGDTYYLFTTGPGISIQRSKDMETWERVGHVMDNPPDWAVRHVVGLKNYLWAPDVIFLNGRWHLYYSGSLFGKSLSVIGLMTSPTLNPDSPDYKWRDDGEVWSTVEGDDYNAIDPNVALDETGQPWLSFGSYWTGIKLVALDPATGKPRADAKLLPIARREPTAIEAPYIIRHAGKFYLFVSFDRCCAGKDSTYNIRVGRADKITGPYVDREGQPMLQSGGTLVLGSQGRWYGPGHNAVYSENGHDWLVYHAYDGEDNGRPKLRITPLQWDEAGWPAVKQITK